MILRSSSTSTLLSPFSDSLPFCSSPVCELNHPKRFQFRRAWSDSNLDKLLGEDLQYPITPNRFFNRSPKIMLQSAPSLSVFVVDEEEDVNGGKKEVLKRTVTNGESSEDSGNGDFSFGKKGMGLIQEEEEDQRIEGLNGIESLNLASGLGIDGIDGGGGDLNLPNFDENGDLEEYYKKMVDEYPSHPLFLANYAQVLQSKGGLREAEEYYYRASMADPEDGGILIKYAKLDWQLHHDQHRALSNFESAAKAAPQDSHVLAAYASFLWEIDDDEEDALQPVEEDFKPSINVSGADDNDVEEHYKKLVQEYPSDSLVLRNYAQFLYQTKRDLQGAEEYYSRAILANPGDGEIKSQYAKLVWELQRDRDKASSYFEQAVEATTDNSNIVAAYASFLWETEENEER